MSASPLSDLARMLEQHIASLRAAGLEWVLKTEVSLATFAATSVPEEAAALSQESVPPPLVAAELSGPVPVGESDDLRPPLSEEPIPEEPAVVASLFEEPAPAPPPPRPVLTLEEKRLALHTLNTTQVVGCTRCAELARTRTQTVFGNGDPGAELMFIGEAPGADEDAQGEPFVGAAGQLLNKIIVACGMTREQVYVGNVLKCRPPGNRTPAPEEIANCRGYLEEQIRIISPRFICCWGAIAAQALLNTPLAIGKLRRKFHDYQGIPVLCTYHPAYLLRTPAAKKDVWEDMKLLLARMGRPVPQMKG